MKKTYNNYLYSLVLLSQGICSVSAGYRDRLPPLSQPNDIAGTVNGCANAILAHDDNGDGAIRRDEFLDYVNDVADLLCLPPRPVLDLELQTIFVSIACLCQEREGNDAACCFGESAGLYQYGADDVAGRTQDEDSYLRAACLFTQAVLGPERCETPVATIDSSAILDIDPADAVTPPPLPAEDDKNLLWLLLLLLLLLLLCCCCYRHDKESDEEYEVVVTEKTIIEGPHDPVGDCGVSPHPEEDVEQALSIPNNDPTSDKGIPPLPVPPNPEDPFSVGGELDEDGNARRPESLMPPMAAGVPGMGEVEGDEAGENVGGKGGANPDDDEDDEGRQLFGGTGELPNPLGPECVVLRHIERETTEKGEYDHPECHINEFKYRREDSGQILPHEEIDSGINIDMRPPREPAIMPKPGYQQNPKPEPVPIDTSKLRKQVGFGDGEVWEALGLWEDEQERTGSVEKIDWVVHNALTEFADVENNGELEKEASSSEEVSDEEEET